MTGKEQISVLSNMYWYNRLLIWPETFSHLLNKKDLKSNWNPFLINIFIVFITLLLML